MQADRVDDRDARAALDRHWAVAALDPAQRRQAQVAAERWWSALRGTHTLEGGVAKLTRAERQAVELVAAAYERAALDRVERATALVPAPGGESGLVEREAVELQVAARRAFLLAGALELPELPDPARLYHVLRVAAMGVVGAEGELVQRWLERVRGELPLDTDDPALAWDVRMRRETTAVWLMLLGGLTPERVRWSFERLGTLRELRLVHEAEFLAAQSAAAAQQARLQLATVYALADAAATVVSHATSGPHAATLGELAARLETARAATTGATLLDRALPWLHLAARLIVAQHSNQLTLPGLL